MSSDSTARSCFGFANRLSMPARRTISTIMYFGAIGMALPGIVEKLMTEGPVKPSGRLLVCDIIWLVIFLLFGFINVIVDDFNIVEIGGYVASILLTTVISTYHFEIPNNQLFVYLPALVDLGIFIAAVGIAIAKMPEDQRRRLVEGLRGFRDSVANLLPAALIPTGAG